jgi:hypothetical protein
MNISNFLNGNGRVSSTRTTEKYVGRNFPDDLKNILDHSEKMGTQEVTFSEKIYYYLNKIESPIRCTNCKINKTKYSGLVIGYSQYCSSKCSNSAPEVHVKKIDSYMKKYGVDNPSKSEEVIKKIGQSFINRFGGNPAGVDYIKEKARKTNLEKYGVDNILQKNSPYRVNKELEMKDLFIKKYSDLDIIEYDPDKNGGCLIRCKKCGNEFDISKWNLHQRTKNSWYSSTPCTVCYPIGVKQKSFIEDHIRGILEKSGVSFTEKDRKVLQGKEIDFLVNKNIGIEIDGIFWHSELYKSNGYHLEKTVNSLKSGVKLYHIFEDEIKHKPDIVESRLNSILGIYGKRIYARDCKIEPVTTQQSRDFLDENHMQGFVGANYKSGLYYKEELVSIMTFGSLRKVTGQKSVSGHWELLRFCNKLGVQVVGGAERLLTNFIRSNNPKEIVSYCDRRWSHGNLYLKIGFELIGETRPNYWYVKNGVREHRFLYRKDVLVRQGEDPIKSESSIMEERGFTRIYDCGSYKFRMVF